MEIKLKKKMTKKLQSVDHENNISETDVIKEIKTSRIYKGLNFSAQCVKTIASKNVLKVLSLDRLETNFVLWFLNN